MASKRKLIVLAVTCRPQLPATGARRLLDRQQFGLIDAATRRTGPLPQKRDHVRSQGTSLAGLDRAPPRPRSNTGWSMRPGEHGRGHVLCSQPRSPASPSQPFWALAGGFDRIGRSPRRHQRILSFPSVPIEMPSLTVMVAQTSAAGRPASRAQTTPASSRREADVLHGRDRAVPIGPIPYIACRSRRRRSQRPPAMAVRGRWTPGVDRGGNGAWAIRQGGG